MKRSYNATEKKFAKNIDLLYRVRQFPNKESLKTIYFSYNHSYLNYANIAWTSTYFMKLKTIHDEQKHAARIICNESLHELEDDYRGESGTAKTSGMELFVAMLNSFYQWTVVTKISVLGVETVPPEHTGLNDQVFQPSASPFSKQIVSNIIS